MNKTRASQIVASFLVLSLLFSAVAGCAKKQGDPNTQALSGKAKRLKMQQGQ